MFADLKAGELFKADFAVLPSIFVVLSFTTLVEKRRISDFVKVLFIFGVSFLVAILLFTLPFGINTVYENVIQLRLRAAQGTSADPQTFINFLKEQKELVDLLIAGSVLSVIAFIGVKTARFPLILLILWVVTTIVSLLIYHPLLPHHLAFLAIPIVVLFSFALFKLLSLIQVPRLLPAAVQFWWWYIVSPREFHVRAAAGAATPLQQKFNWFKLHRFGRHYYQRRQDCLGFIGSADTPVFDRHLVCAIASGASPGQQGQPETYHPKMVLVWADRLRNIPNLKG
jgi:hypothetical protein